MTKPEVTYGDIEPVTRELINMAVAGRDPYGLVKVRHLDAMFRVLADRAIAATPEMVRADIEYALNCFDDTAGMHRIARDGEPASD